MIREYDKVIIKSSGVAGEVVDIFEVDDKKMFTVESDARGVPGGIGFEGDYKLFHCREEELQVRDNA